MEEEELNKRLSARITEVFDNYEDTTADEGWALLRQKFLEEKKDRGLIWWWYAAAAVLLLGFGLWFMQGPADVKKQVAVNVKPANKQPEQPAVITEADTLQHTASINSVAKTTSINQGQSNGKSGIRASTVTKQPLIAIAKTKSGGAALSQGSGKSNVNQPAVGQPAQNMATTTNGVTPVGGDNYAGNKPASTTTGQTTNAITATGADSISNPNQAIAQNPNKPAATKPALTSAEALAKLFAETANNPKDIKTSPKKDKKPVIGVYAATYFNYANGSDNRVNVGAGVSSDFSITRKLKLSTGVAIAQNSLNYDYSKSSNNSASNDVARASLNPAGSALNTSGLYNSSISSLGYDSFLTPSTPQNYSASLIGLDVPVNLKYEFNPGKSETYVSAGLSSGTFINQTYTTEYAANARQVAQTTTTQNNFGNFYFAKMLNVSFGMGYSVGKNNRLVVEPFLKYPLSGLGAQQIKFGAGGINLKLNFTTYKK